MMDLVVLAAALISGSALLWLARRDPKRLRLLGRRNAAAARQPRRLATLIVIAPGLGLLLCGEWAGLMIWAGAVLAAGWLLTQTLAVRGDESASDA